MALTERGTIMPDTPIIAAAGDYGDQRPVAESSSSGVSWPAIIGGAFASVALAVLLFTLGSGLGLASVSPWANTGATVTTVTVMTGIWLIVMHWLASGLGGYLTGRLRTKWAGLHTHEVFFRDTANGFLSWAVASVAGAVIVATTAAFFVSGTAAIATGAAGGAAKGAMQSAALSGGPSAYLVDRLFRTDHPNAAGADTDAKAQAGAIILNGLATGDVPAPDKAYLALLVSAHTGVAPDEAAKRVDQIIADAKAAEVKVKQGADSARKAGATLTIFTGLAMLIGAFIACAAAALGGQQRDAVA
jgi:hypothetical protein